MTPEELLQHATEFSFLPPGMDRSDPHARYFDVQVSRRSEGKWAVVSMGQVWCDGEWAHEKWVYEALPSNRTEEFIASTRFPLEEAIEIAQKATETVTHVGFNYAEFLVRMEQLKKKEQEAK